MDITVNSKKRSFENAKTVKEILNELNIKSENGIAVAVNKSVITKSDWDDFELKENDSMLLIQATQGG
ncbi:MAG: thiamine biosynthesis protein ThiS [Bacteroidetes bacterium]|nr:MAG: thiamine biosynthesis protein ThiS [Bacteroidota bacterium]